MHFLPDVARGLARLGAHPEAPGRVWHLPAAGPLTGQQILDLFGAAFGRPVRVRTAGPRTLRMLGVAVPMLREVAGVTYQWQAPWVVDATAFLRDLGAITLTPHGEAVQQTAVWWRARQARAAVPSNSGPTP